MRRGLLIAVLLVVAGYFAYKYFIKDDAADEAKPAPIAVTATDSLTITMAAALQSYYDLKDAFVKSDSSLVNQKANDFMGKLQAISMDQVKADTALIELAGQLQQNIYNDSKTIAATPDLQEKRKTFQILSDHLFDLLRTVRYSGSKVYQQYCPMAFNNTGAAWLSNDTEIFNPYFGDKMLHCGEVRDSLRTD